MATSTQADPKKQAWYAEMWGEIDRFWFSFGSATSLGIFRIFMGFMNLANLLLILPFFDAWYTERGYTPLELTERAADPITRDFVVFNSHFTLPFTIPRVDVFGGMTNSTLFLSLYIVLIAAAVLTTIGLWTRVSSIVLAVGIVSLQHRNLLILHGGDSVVRLGALYMALAPSGRACSLDRLIALWKGKVKPGPAMVSLWPQRVIAFNLALIYFTTWWVKMDGDRWRTGSATWFPAHLPEFYRFWVPPFLKTPFMTPFLTYGTLATELALGTIVFWRPARKWVLLAGIGMHGYIEWSMNIPLFGYSMCAYYIVFYEGEEVTAWFKRLGNRLKRFQLTVHVPTGVDHDAPQALAIQATDPLGLVTYETGDSQELVAESGDHEYSSPIRAIWIRSIGAWVLGMVPGLWRRMVTVALTRGAKA